jgi:hypothetical protein
MSTDKVGLNGAGEGGQPAQTETASKKKFREVIVMTPSRVFTFINPKYAFWMPDKPIFIVVDKEGERWNFAGHITINFKGDAVA